MKVCKEGYWHRYTFSVLSEDELTFLEAAQIEKLCFQNIPVLWNQLLQVSQLRRRSFLLRHKRLGLEKINQLDSKMLFDKAFLLGFQHFLSFNACTIVNVSWPKLAYCTISGTSWSTWIKPPPSIFLFHFQTRSWSHTGQATTFYSEIQSVGHSAWAIASLWMYVT